MQTAHTKATAGVFSDLDVRQIEERGISVELALEQIRTLRNPPAAAVLVRPCTVGDGIESAGDEKVLLDAARSAASEGRVTKFVPASGAASRMFKDLVAALEDASQRPSELPQIRELFGRLDDFPFAQELRRCAAVGVEPETEDAERRLLGALVDGLGYRTRPKALIPFHRGRGGVRTAFEEHLFEACRFALSRDGRCRVHFTVAQESLQEFQSALAAVAPILSSAHGCAVDASFSVQHAETDTMAIDGKGSPFRGSDGTLLFRPGGHGALIRNLEEVRGDIVVIKNVDNVVPEAASHDVVRWKQMLIGCLVGLQRETFEILDRAATGNGEEMLDGAIAFARSRFSRRPGAPLLTADEKRAFVVDALQRPIRVCGVVKNQGEPGGAPFWTAGSAGETVQIVESSQVDFADPGQEHIWRSATHFNPVDIVCGMRDRHGNPFELSRFVDRSAVFVAKKSFEGRELRALELPGLWNGAMAGWNTVCVEVPASTFAPVKTVFDLLRPQHQSLP